MKKKGHGQRGEKPKLTQKSVIITDYECNNNCLFCIDQEKRGRFRPRTTVEIIAELVAAKKRGSTYIEFIGGEISIRPDCFTIVREAKKLDFTVISLTTNGRMYSYPEFVKKMKAAGLTSIVFSIHGHNARLHDKLTRSPGSFNQLKKGLANFRKLGFKNIGSNTTIVRQNYKSLPLIGEFIYGLGIRNSEFIFVDPTSGGGKVDFFKVVPKINEIIPYVRKCLAIGRDKNIPHWHIRYLPLCRLSDYLDQISELQEVRTFHTVHIAPDFQNFDVERSRATIGRIKSKVCRECTLNNICEGVWKNYADKYGLEELKPVK